MKTFSRNYFINFSRLQSFHILPKNLIASLLKKINQMNNSSHSSNSTFIWISIWYWQNLHLVLNVLTPSCPTVSAQASISQFSAFQGFIAHFFKVDILFSMRRVGQSNWKVQGVFYRVRFFILLPASPLEERKVSAIGLCISLHLSVWFTVVHIVTAIFRQK